MTAAEGFNLELLYLTRRGTNESWRDDDLRALRSNALRTVRQCELRTCSASVYKEEWVESKPTLF